MLTCSSHCGPRGGAGVTCPLRDAFLIPTNVFLIRCSTQWYFWMFIIISVLLGSADFQIPRSLLLGFIPKVLWVGCLILSVV